MAITTLYSRVNRAVSFFNKPMMHYCIGKTTAWSDPNDATIDDTNPPAPTGSETQVLEIVGFKRVETLHLVVRDNTNGTISYRNDKWRIVAEADAYTEGAKFVYAETWINYDELPLEDYRQIGLYTELQIADGVSTAKYNLLPSEVSFNGYLHCLDNRTPYQRKIDQREKLTIIMEF